MRGSFLLCIALLLDSGPLGAQALSGSFALVSDDAFRGVSQSDGQASFQADLHSRSPLFLGLSAEAVRRGSDEQRGAELTVYGGYRQALSEDWDGALLLRHYAYPGNARRSRYDYDELGLSLTWHQRLTLAACASPDTYAEAYRDGYPRYGRGAAYCLEAAVRQPLPRGWAVHAGIGYYDLRSEIGSGYSYWSAGVSCPWQAWLFDLSYVGADATAARLLDQRRIDRLVLAVIWSF